MGSIIRGRARDLSLLKLVEFVGQSEDSGEMSASAAFGRLVTNILKTGIPEEGISLRKDMKTNISTFVWNHPGLTEDEIADAYSPLLRRAVEVELQALSLDGVVQQERRQGKIVYVGGRLRL